LLVGAIAVPVAIAVTATAAHADTSTASASAVNLSLLGTPIPAPATASNDGTQPVQTAGFPTGNISLLPANPIVSAGALGQLAVANPDGSSAACAGLVAPSSALAIAPTGTCDAGSSTTGIQLNLGVVQLKAGALSAQCTADSSGNVQGSAQLASARIVTPGVPPFIPDITLVNLPLNPPPNTGIVSGVLNLVLNKQVINPDGSITITALEITGIGTGIEIGKVSCGPNIQVADVPLVPGLPAGGTAIAAGAVAAIAGVAGARRLRNRQAMAA
jgi:hypothetical protein